jgi:hypothetical protein
MEKNITDTGFGNWIKFWFWFGTPAAFIWNWSVKCRE